MSGRPAVFFDRDGVLNKVIMRGSTVASPRRLDEFVIDDGVAEALESLRARGLPLFALTNQPDISRGLLEPGTLDAMHAELQQALPLADVVACPHDDKDHCDCRKPKPGLLFQLATRWGIDLSRSFMIGDQDRDMSCGRAADCTTILLQRDYNQQAQADHRAADIRAAADLVLSTLDARDNNT